MTRAKTGGDQVVEQLVRHGVSTVFGLYGAHLDAVYQACRSRDVKIIDTRHEATAGHAAEGYARTADTLGVALVTAGGGFTNAMTSLANAKLDRTAVLYLTGSAPHAAEETNTLQAGIDQVAMATPVTKWAHRIEASENIGRMVAQAIRIATTSPKGPVLLDIPMELLAGPAETREFYGADELLPPSINEVDADRILELIEAAERPMILVGADALPEEARQALDALSVATGAPVMADYHGLGALSRLPSKVAAGLVQNLGTAADARPDMLLMLGLRFGLSTRHGSGEIIPRAATVVQVDPDAREIGRLQTVQLGLVADIPAVLKVLAQRVAGREWRDLTEWQEAISGANRRRRDAIIRRTTAESSSQLHPFAASRAVAEQIDPSVTVIADGALTYHWLTEVIAEARPNAFFAHGYLGSMGCGFGVALGAAVADAESGRRTLLVTGDGSIGFGMSDFDTLVRHDIPLVVVVMNNRSWGATQHFQEMTGGDAAVVSTPLPNGNYQDAARAFGALGFGASSADQLSSALDESIRARRPACIDVEVDLLPIPPEEAVMMGADPLAEGPIQSAGFASAAA